MATISDTERVHEPESYARTPWAKIKKLFGRGIIHAVLLFVAAISLLPLVYMLSTSLKERGREFSHPIEWIPDKWEWNFFTRATA